MRQVFAHEALEAVLALLLAQILLTVSLCVALDAAEFRPARIGPGDQQPRPSEEKHTPVTMAQVRAALDPDEPDYVRAARLGGDALPHLERLIEGGDPGLASKAVYLASVIRDRRSAVLVHKAAKSDRGEVRVAAAAATRHLPRRAASAVLLVLLSDPDSGVRRVALTSVKLSIGSGGFPSALRARIEALANADPDPRIRELSRAILGQVRPLSN